MALAANPLYSEATRQPLPDLIPENRPDAIVTRQFAAAAAGAETLPVGTPVFIAAATGFAAKIVPGSGTAEQTEVWGFVYPNPIVLKASGGGEVLGTIMQFGQAAYRDIRAIQVASVLAGTEAQLKTALRKPKTKERGLTINGLDLQGGP